MSPPAASSSPQPFPSPIRIEALLAHREWVRALARTLVRDESSADDVEQQTWQAALENPPSKEGSVRAWLGSVVRRVVLDSQRRHVRRERREAIVARPEGLPATSDVVARIEIDRAVVNCVAELPEPYRTTLLLRFYDGLPPRDVATRMGVPVETVRARVRRGLERVRVGLDGRHGGDRGVWTAAIVPFLAGPTGLGLPPASGTGSGSGTASATSLATPAVTAAVVVGALVLGAVGGFQLESLAGSDAASATSKSDALLAAERALDDEMRDLAALSGHVAGLRAQSADLNARFDELSARGGSPESDADAAAVASTTPVDYIRPPFERSLTFPEYESVLSRVDWDDLGAHLALMIPLMGEVYGDRSDGRPLRPEAVGQLQVHNGAVIAVVVPLDESFPGNAENSALTHPAFASTMAAALCHASDLPLGPEQLTALDRAAKDAADAVDRAVDGASEREFRLEAIIEETEAKLVFVAALREILTPEQRALLGHDALRDVVGFDLFGPAQMWVGGVETGIFSRWTDVSSVIAGGLSRALDLDPSRKAEIASVVNAWLASLPEGYIEQAPNAIEELESAFSVDTVQVAARHMLELMRRVSQLDLTAEQRAWIQRSREVLILRRRP